MLLLKAQTVPSRRDPLRKDRPKLSRRRHSRRHCPMDALVSTPPSAQARKRLQLRRQTEECNSSRVSILRVFTQPGWSFASVWPDHGDFRGRDASYLAPPAQIRTSPIRAYGLYGAFFVKEASRHFCRPLSFHSFVRPAPRAFFRPDRHICIAVARRGGQGRRFFSAAACL